MKQECSKPKFEDCRR